MQTTKSIVLLAQRVRALAQNGLTYSLNEYDTERYSELLEISDSLTALTTATPVETVHSLYMQCKEYATPKVDIRAVVFNEAEEILLVREKADGLWSLPGGWSDIGYTPKEIAVKEVREETGLEVEAERLLAVMDMREHNHPVIPFYVYKFFILCRMVKGEFTEAFDILDKDFFPVDKLPPLSLERVLPEQIRMMYFRWKNPQDGVYLD